MSVSAGTRTAQDPDDPEWKALDQGVAILLQYFMLDGANKNDGFLVNAALAEKAHFYVPDTVQHCTIETSITHDITKE